MARLRTVSPTSAAYVPVRVSAREQRPCFSDSFHRGQLRVRIPLEHLGECVVPVGYELHGPHQGPSITVLGGISAGRHLAPAPDAPEPGWWPGVVGSACALDPARHRLLGIDYLGGNSGGQLLRPVTTFDQARALAAVLDAFAIPVTSLVGASYGGMVALAFAELFPDRTDRMVILCAAHRPHPMATAVRAVQRSIAQWGLERGEPARGLSLARALAMTTYRSAAEFEARFSARPVPPVADAARFPVEDYLEARGAAFVRDFDAERFLALSESIDLHQTDPGSLPGRARLVSVDTDTLVPPWLVGELAGRGGRCPARHVRLESLYGHDGFLRQTAEVSAQVGAALSNLEVVR